MENEAKFPYLEDDSEARLREVLEYYGEEARRRGLLLIEEARVDQNGCFVTDTVKPRKIRFNGHQWEAYRFIYCVLNGVIAPRRSVIRHRCHNRLCINPDHLVIGSQADNKRDDWERAAYGIDPDFL